MIHKCPWCKSKLKNQNQDKCGFCLGTGKEDRWMRGTLVCSECNGTGYVKKFDFGLLPKSMRKMEKT